MCRLSAGEVLELRGDELGVALQELLAALFHGPEALLVAPQLPHLGLGQVHGLVQLCELGPELLAGHQAFGLLVLVARPLDPGLVDLVGPARDLLYPSAPRPLESGLEKMVEFERELTPGAPAEETVLQTSRSKTSALTPRPLVQPLFTLYLERQR